MSITSTKLDIIGIDLATRVFHVHGAFDDGTVLSRRLLSRAKVHKSLFDQPCCTVAMETCRSSHYCASELEGFGHTVLLIPPAYVKPFVKRQKNDANDAEASVEAAQRPNMTFVAHKTEEQ